MRALVSVAAGLLVMVVMGCAAPAPPGSDSAHDPTPAATAAPTASTAAATAVASPAVTPVPTLSLNELDHHRVELSSVDATALCDPEPGQFDPDADETTIGCSDALVWAMTAVRTVTADAPLRAYVRRPECRAAPCPDDALHTVTVIVWTTSDAYQVDLDSRVDTVIGPLPVDGASAWPTSGTATPPAVARPTIKGSPRAVAQREPYPYCGRAEIGEPPEVDSCFRAAVLDGRPAEMIERVYGTEGGEILRIYRYDGSGRVAMFQHDRSVDADGGTADTWRVVQGSMILGVTPTAWSFDPWDGTEGEL